MKNCCPVCGEVHLTQHVEKINETYMGVSRSIETLYSICAICGSETATDEQIHHNLEVRQKFHHEIEEALRKR